MKEEEKMRSPIRSRALRAVAGGAVLAGVAVLAAGAPALAATPEVPTAGLPLPALPTSPAEDPADGPAPAPTAPYVESSYTAFDAGDVLNQLRDFTPAGGPLAGLVQSAAGTTKLIPS
jgi:hypothetical protein